MEDDHVLDEVPVEHIKAAPSKCTENDVILGRGRAINNWPGNVHFRQLALKYREAYSQANRYQKVEIARLLMAEITARDGRFVRLVDHPKSSSSSSSSLKGSGSDCDFVVVSQVNEARAIEKTCQALRDRCFYDKQVVHDHNERPVGTNVNAAIPSHLNDDDDATGAAGIPGNDDHVESTLTSGIDVLPTNTATNLEQRKPTRRHRPLLVSFSTLDMLQRLRHFQSTFSHARVPPNYQDDVVLADWCTVQRQLYRQYQSGYYSVLLPQQQQQPAPPAAAPLPPLDQAQMDLFDTLNSLDFCWDYDEWHWHYWLDQAVATGSDPLHKSIRVWLHQQRRQHRDGTLSRLRSEKMQEAGFLPASGTKTNFQTGT